MFVELLKVSPLVTQSDSNILAFNLAKAKLPTSPPKPIYPMTNPFA